MDAERDTDGTTDAHEGDHTPADGAGTEGEGGKPDTRPVCFVKRWCAVLPWVAVRVTGQLFTGLPSAGFVWFWLFCYCMRAWVRL